MFILENIKVILRMDIEPILLKKIPINICTDVIFKL